MEALQGSDKAAAQVHTAQAACSPIECGLAILLAV